MHYFILIGRLILNSFVQSFVLSFIITLMGECREVGLCSVVVDSVHVNKFIYNNKQDHRTYSDNFAINVSNLIYHKVVNMIIL